MKLTLLSITTLVAAVSVAAAPTLPSSSSAPLMPADDPFYQPPSGWEESAPGTVLKTRNVTIALATVIPVPVTGYQLLYRTNDAFDKPMVTATTLMVPDGAKADRVLAYANAENSNNVNCAPSFLIQKGANTSSQTALVGEQATYEKALLDGWIITLMDHEGPNSAYAYGPQAGKAVLDSVRATIAFGPAIGLDPTAKAVLWGYSGGAIAVSWAEALVNSYAPELHIVGGAHGGTPASLQPCVELINGGVSAGLLVAAFTGIASADPAFSAAYYELATPKLKAIIADTIAHTCGGPSGLNFVDLFATTEYFTSGQATLSTPAFQTMFNVTKLGTGVSKSLTPPMPVHVYHAKDDELIPYAVAADMVKGWCDQGGNVEFLTQTTPQIEHLGEAGYAAVGVLQFFADRFDGVPFTKGCTYKYDPAGVELPPVTNSSVVN